MNLSTANRFNVIARQNSPDFLQQELYLMADTRSHDAFAFLRDVLYRTHAHLTPTNGLGGVLSMMNGVDNIVSTANINIPAVAVHLGPWARLWNFLRPRLHVAYMRQAFSNQRHNPIQFRTFINCRFRIMNNLPPFTAQLQWHRYFTYVGNGQGSIRWPALHEEIMRLFNLYLGYLAQRYPEEVDLYTQAYGSLGGALVHGRVQLSMTTYSTLLVGGCKKEHIDLVRKRHIIGKLDAKGGDLQKLIKLDGITIAGYETDNFYYLLKIKNMVDDNNCAVRVFAHYYRQYLKPHYERDPFNMKLSIPLLRRFVLPGNIHGPISIDELDTVGSALGLNYSCLGPDGEIIKSNLAIHPDSNLQVVLLLHDSHYWGIVPSKWSIKQSKYSCTSCGKDLRFNHLCEMEDLRILDKQRELLAQELAELQGRVSREVKQDTISAVKALRRGKNLFINGRAGTGKSYSLEIIRKQLLAYDITEGEETQHLSESDFCFTASTGTAAVNIDGRTIHSLTGITKSKDSAEALRKVTREDCAMLKLIKYLVIDEISMFCGEEFDMAEEVIRHVRQVDEPFGGLQLILVGDFSQLPPVEQQRGFLFQSHVFQSMHASFHFMTLRETHRFSDEVFSQMMERISIGAYLRSDIERLYTRNFHSLEQAVLKCKQDGNFPVVAFGRIIDVTKYNQEVHKTLSGVRFSIKAKVGAMNYIPSSYVPTNFQEEFIVSSQVMLRKNMFDTNMKLCNGAVGVISSFNAVEKYVQVIFKFGTFDIPVQKVEYVTKNKKVIEVNAIPLVDAYAMTIHKLQGRTLDSLIVDASTRSFFGEGSAYVALSRVRDLASLYLVKFEEEGLKRINPHCLKFLAWMDQGSTSPFIEVIPTDMDLDCDMSMPLSITKHKMINFDNAIQYQQLKEDRTLVKMNTIFFDFETFPNECKEHICYYNYILHYLNGNIAEQVELCKMCDPTLDVLQATVDFIKAKIFGVIDYLEQKHARNLDNIRSGSKRPRPSSGYEYGKDPLYISAYNGGGFDFLFLLQRLKNDEEFLQRVVIRPTFKSNAGSRICNLTFMMKDHGSCERMIARTVDMALILGAGTTLDKATKEYCDANHVKTAFPHKRIPELMQVSSPSYGQWDQAGVDSSYFNDASGIDCANFIPHRELHKYGQNDVVILQELTDKIDEVTHEVLKTSVFRFSTQAQMTNYGFKLYLPTALLKEKSKKKGDSNKIGYEGTKITRIYTTSRKMDDIFASGYIGGRTYPRGLHFKSSDAFEEDGTVKPYNAIKDALTDNDIVSMYAGAMKDNDFPYGPVETIADHEPRWKLWWDRIKNRNLHALHPSLTTHFIAVEVTCQPHINEIEPPIGCKRPVKIPAEADPINYEGVTKLCWDNRERRQVLFHPDLYLLLKNEGTVSTLHRLWIWPERGPVFKEWINLCLQGKIAAAAAKESGKKSWYKTMCNAAYGSVLQKDHDKEVVWMDTANCVVQEEFFDRYKNIDVLNADEFWNGSAKVLMASGVKKLSHAFEACSRPRYLGGFILGYSRMIFDRVADVVLGTSRRDGKLSSATSNQIFYGDTDSFFLSLEQRQRLLDADMIGNDVGQLNDDLSDETLLACKIIECYTPAPKTYGLLYVDKNNQVHSKVICKGIPKRHKEMNFDSFRKHANELFSEEKPDGMEVSFERPVIPHGVQMTRPEQAKGLKSFAVSSGQMNRTVLKTTWQGRRQLDGTHYTVPHGWNGV